MLGLAAMNKVFRILLMCDKSRGHVIVIVNGVGPCVHDAGPGWLVLLRGGCEVVCARGDVRLCRIEDVSRVCCRVRCGGGVFVGDWSTRDLCAGFCPAGDSVGYVYFVSWHWRAAIIGACIMGTVVLLGCI
jgi:hypothetical protein